jgi:hypothetical protein
MSKMISILLAFILSANAESYKVYSHDMYGNKTSGALSQLKLSVLNAEQVGLVIETENTVQSFKPSRVFSDANKVCAEVSLLAVNHRLSPVNFVYQSTPAYALFCTDGVEYVSSSSGRYLNRMSMTWFRDI